MLGLAKESDYNDAIKRAERAEQERDDARADLLQAQAENATLRQELSEQAAAHEAELEVLRARLPVDPERGPLTADEIGRIPACGPREMRLRRRAVAAAAVREVQAEQERMRSRRLADDVNWSNTV